MHVTPSDLRMLRQDGTVVRFALLGPMAFVLADIPASGSPGTPLEQPCTNPHWGFVVAGDVQFEAEGRRQPVLPGSAFHVPSGGPPHRFFVAGEARIAGFEAIDPALDTSDAALVARGFEPFTGQAVEAATVVPASIDPIPERGQVATRSWSMSGFVLTQARFGPASGYTAQWCDAPHWGLVSSGRVAIEWEDDIEIVASGDVYHCPGGPPGHRFEAADAASIVDLTPIDGLTTGRIADWRASAADHAERLDRSIPISVAGLG